MDCDRCGAARVREKKQFRECSFCKPPKDAFERVAQQIVKEHKGSWGGVLLQIDWMADIIREGVVS